jgi:hypothetical protein
LSKADAESTWGAQREREREREREGEREGGETLGGRRRRKTTTLCKLSPHHTTPHALDLKLWMRMEDERD